MTIINPLLEANIHRKNLYDQKNVLEMELAQQVNAAQATLINLQHINRQLAALDRNVQMYQMAQQQQAQAQDGETGPVPDENANPETPVEALKEKFPDESDRKERKRVIKRKPKKEDTPIES